MYCTAVWTPFIGLRAGVLNSILRQWGMFCRNGFGSTTSGYGTSCENFPVWMEDSPLPVTRQKGHLISGQTLASKKRWSKWVFLPSAIPFLYLARSSWISHAADGWMDGLTENRFLDLPPPIAQSLLTPAERSTAARKPHKTGARGGPLSPRQTCSQS